MTVEPVYPRLVLFLYFGRLETFSIFLSMHQEVGIGTYLPTYNAGLVAGLWLSAAASSGMERKRDKGPCFVLWKLDCHRLLFIRGNKIRDSIRCIIMSASVTRKKLPNVCKSCLKMMSLEK